MKYTVYAIKNEKVTVYGVALTSDSEWKEFEKVAEARTKAEAKKIISTLGWITEN